MLPETAALLVFNRYLLSAYSPSTPNAPPAISPLAIATPHMIRSWLNGVLLLFNYNVALRRNDDGVFNNLLNLSTQETRPERSDAQFHQSNHFKEFTRQPISSTPTSSQSGVSSRVSKGKLQLRMPRESRDSGVGSSSSSAMNEASRPSMSANSRRILVDNNILPAPRQTRQNSTSIARDDPYEAASLPQMRSAFFSAMVVEES
ncbi:hypothetical protein Aperf_G00000013693 [Anoplocephala perfoliata]